MSRLQALSIDEPPGHELVRKEDDWVVSFLWCIFCGARCVYRLEYVLCIALLVHQLSKLHIDSSQGLKQG